MAMAIFISDFEEIYAHFDMKTCILLALVQILDRNLLYESFNDWIDNNNVPFGRTAWCERVENRCPGHHINVLYSFTSSLFSSGS